MSITNLLKNINNSIIETGNGMESAMFHPISSIKKCNQDSKYTNIGKCFGYLSSYVPTAIVVLYVVAKN